MNEKCKKCVFFFCIKFYKTKQTNTTNPNGKLFDLLYLIIVKNNNIKIFSNLEVYYYQWIITNFYHHQMM